MGRKAWAAGAALLLAGCSGGGLAPPPDASDDIGAGNCLYGSDCASGLCVNNTCQLSPNGGPCLHGSDCESGLCTNNLCAGPSDLSQTAGLDIASGVDLSAEGGDLSATVVDLAMQNPVDLAMSTPADSAMAPQDLAAPVDLATPPDLAVPIYDLAMPLDMARTFDLACSPNCANGQFCLHGTDCTSMLCINNVCTQPPDLSSPVDFANCSPNCASGDPCLFGSDCLSLMCVNNVCTGSPADLSPPPPDLAGWKCSSLSVEWDIEADSMNDTRANDIIDVAPVGNGEFAIAYTMYGPYTFPVYFMAAKLDPKTKKVTAGPQSLQSDLTYGVTNPRISSASATDPIWFGYTVGNQAYAFGSITNDFGMPFGGAGVSCFDNFQGHIVDVMQAGGHGVLVGCGGSGDQLVKFISGAGSAAFAAGEESRLSAQAGSAYAAWVQPSASKTTLTFSTLDPTNGTTTGSPTSATMGAATDLGVPTISGLGFDVLGGVPMLAVEQSVGGASTASLLFAVGSSLTVVDPGITVVARSNRFPIGVAAGPGAFLVAYSVRDATTSVENAYVQAFDASGYALSARLALSDGLTDAMFPQAAWDPSRTISPTGVFGVTYAKQTGPGPVRPHFAAVTCQ